MNTAHPKPPTANAARRRELTPAGKQVRPCSGGVPALLCPGCNGTEGTIGPASGCHTVRVSAVEVSTYEYERSHGRTPRGTGGWAFIPERYLNDGNYLDYILWVPGPRLYRDARAAARRWFAERGETEIVACP